MAPQKFNRATRRAAVIRNVERIFAPQKTDTALGAGTRLSKSEPSKSARIFALAGRKLLPTLQELLRKGFAQNHTREEIRVKPSRQRNPKAPCQPDFIDDIPFGCSLPE
jgi:hypothetical protein